MTSPFEPILNWKLKKGSHKFPGPDGGTCINEAAIVAAGFEYRAVKGPDDMPLCFSKVISGYALALNDLMPDAMRQTLLAPFVLRLAGSADAGDVEVARRNYMRLETVRLIVSSGLRALGHENLAFAAKNARDHNDASSLLTFLSSDPNLQELPVRAASRDPLEIGQAPVCAQQLWQAKLPVSQRGVKVQVEDTYLYFRVLPWSEPVDLRLHLRVETEIHDLWISAVNILDGALKIGRQADPADLELVTGRMQAARAAAPEAVDA